MLAYLSRYTHRVAIEQSPDPVRWPRCHLPLQRLSSDGTDRQQAMTLPADQFIRRFLLHVLPTGFHRIRHYGLLAGATHKANIALARKLLEVAPPPEDEITDEPEDYRPPCPHCGGHMIVIETLRAGSNHARRHPPYRPSGNLRHDPAWLDSPNRARDRLPAMPPLVLQIISRMKTTMTPSLLSDLLTKSGHRPAHLTHPARFPASVIKPLDRQKPKPHSPTHAAAGSCFGTSVRLRRPEPFTERTFRFWLLGNNADIRFKGGIADFGLARDEGANRQAIAVTD